MRDDTGDGWKDVLRSSHTPYYAVPVHSPNPPSPFFLSLLSVNSANPSTNASHQFCDHFYIPLFFPYRQQVSDKKAAASALSVVATRRDILGLVLLTQALESRHGVSVAVAIAVMHYAYDRVLEREPENVEKKLIANRLRCSRGVYCTWSLPVVLPAPPSTYPAGRFSNRLSAAAPSLNCIHTRPLLLLMRTTFPQHPRARISRRARASLPCLPHLLNPFPFLHP